MRAVIAERSRIARELHDTLIQGFSGVTMQLQALLVRLSDSPQRRTLDEIIHDAGVCLREARRSVAGLRNSAQGESGLTAAIAQAARQLTETHDVRLTLKLEPAPADLPSDVQYNLLRIAQEAISNAVRHSGAGTIEVALDCMPQQLRLSVRDDGVGLPTDGTEPASQQGHYGLVGMRERAHHIGAEYRLESSPGRGTLICVTLATDGSPRDAAMPPARQPAATEGAH